MDIKIIAEYLQHQLDWKSNSLKTITIDSEIPQKIREDVKLLEDMIKHLTKKDHGEIIKEIEDYILSKQWKYNNPENREKIGKKVIKILDDSNIDTYIFKFLNDEVLYVKVGNREMKFKI